MTTTSSRRVLDPVDRVSEILFGLIMALTFTCTISVAEAGEAEVREMLVGALGCNIAWGIVDGTIFVLMNLIERARAVALHGALLASRDPAEARRLVADALPPLLAQAVPDEELEHLRARLVALPMPTLHARPRRDDWLGAIAIFLLVVLSTLPVAAPFAVIDDVGTALRTSNAIALAMLFACGAVLARYAGRPPWLVGLVMSGIGAALVAITIALGG